MKKPKDGGVTRKKKRKRRIQPASRAVFRLLSISAGDRRLEDAIEHTTDEKARWEKGGHESRLFCFSFDRRRRRCRRQAKEKKKTVASVSSPSPLFFFFFSSCLSFSRDVSLLLLLFSFRFPSTGAESSTRHFDQRDCRGSRREKTGQKRGGSSMERARETEKRKSNDRTRDKSRRRRLLCSFFPFLFIPLGEKKTPRASFSIHGTRSKRAHIEARRASERHPHPGEHNGDESRPIFFLFALDRQQTAFFLFFFDGFFFSSLTSIFAAVATAAVSVSPLSLSLALSFSPPSPLRAVHACRDGVEARSSRRGERER